MKLGIDCIDVDLTYKGGVSTYTFGLLDGFSKFKSETKHFVIFCTPENKTAFDKYENLINFTVIVVNGYKTSYRKFFLLIPFICNSLYMWRMCMSFYTFLFGTKRLIEDNCDIYYAPHCVLNFYDLKIPTIVSMHDIQQYHYPEFFGMAELRMRRLTYENSAKIATYIQASSTFIKNDLLSHFLFLDPDRIVVVPEGVDISQFRVRNKVDIRKKYKILNDYLFFPAQLWKHKNHITILKALKNIENDGFKIPLIMTGANYSSSTEVLKFISDNKMDYVHYLGKVDFPELLALYKDAKFLVTAVLYESSSLPILEAAACGVPIIASKTPPNIEMSKRLKMSLFDPLDVKHCSSIIKEKWLEDKDFIEKQVSENIYNIQYYSWENAAKRYLNFIDENIIL